MSAGRRRRSSSSAAPCVPDRLRMTAQRRRRIRRMPSKSRQRRPGIGKKQNRRTTVGTIDRRSKTPVRRKSIRLAGRRLPGERQQLAAPPLPGAPGAAGIVAVPVPAAPAAPLPPTQFRLTGPTYDPEPRTPVPESVTLAAGA